MPRRLLKPRLATFLGLLVLFSRTGTARAEQLEFHAGGTVHLPAVIDGDQVIVEGPTGPLRFPRSDFLRMEPETGPVQEWPSRIAEARRGDLDARFAAAWWALENGLNVECVAVLREIHATDPAHEPTARMIETLDRLAQTIEDPDLRRLGPLRPAGMSVLRSPHVVLLHQIDPDEADRRLALFERVLTSYYLNLTAYGMHLDVPSRRLPFLWYRDQTTYKAALKAAGAADFVGTLGYFHPTLEVVLSFDRRTEPTMERDQARIDAGRREHDRLRVIVATRPETVPIRLGLNDEPSEGLSRAEAEARLDHLSHDLDRQQLLLDVRRIDRESSLAAHELIHALVRASQLAPRHDSFPKWLQEGLAMQYEVVRDGRWSGVGRLNPLRMPYWDRSPTASALMPLLHDGGFDHGYDPGTYARAWGLVFFLRKEHPEEFLMILDRLRNRQGAVTPPDDRAREALRTLFGPDLSEFERRWRSYLDALCSESDRPGAALAGPQAD